ncbi:MAG: GNAT family N-acetyltransferase [Magnetococcales bacterium]|nr:GNAT family N-acetyltransferase [Magnetococcales bacterium]
MDESWSRLELETEAARQQAIGFANRVMTAAGGTHLLSDLEWALCGGDCTDNLLVYGFDRGEAGAGFALFRIQQRPLKFRVGELTLFQVGLTRYDLWQQPIIVVAGADQGSWTAQASALLARLHLDLPARSALGVEGVQMAGMFLRLLSAHPDFSTLQMGAPFKHQFINMPSSYEAYLAGLGASSRKTFLYRQRRLYRVCEGVVALRRFSQPEEVEGFLDGAVAVSQKTYQWQLLGLGLRNRKGLARRLDFAAKRGWLCSYLLYCQEKPVAFMLGYHHGRCYHYIDVGFDRDWGKHSVGSVLQLEVMADLYRLEVPPERFDFSTGFGEHKARFGNREEAEVNLLLFPKNLSNQALVTSYRGFEWCMEGLLGLLERMGVKQTIKKALRRSAGLFSSDK